MTLPTHRADPVPLGDGAAQSTVNPGVTLRNLTRS